MRPPEPEPIRDAVIEGEIVDIVTGEGVGGATILADRVSGPTEAAISDEQGAFRIEVSAGRYHTLVYYADYQIELDGFEVGPQETVRREIGLDPAALPNVEPLFPECPKVANDYVASPADTEALTAAVLERFVRDPSTIGSGREFQAGETIYVDSEIRGRSQVTAGALPTGGLYTFVLKPRQELQSLADLRGIPFLYVGFVTADVAGDCATVDVEVFVASPTRSESGVLYDCSQSVLYEKRDGKWQFKIDSMASCS